MFVVVLVFYFSFVVCARDSCLFLLCDVDVFELCVSRFLFCGVCYMLMC